MFTILSHKGNINQNYPKILSYPVRLTIIKKKSTTNAGENVGKGTLKKLKTDLPDDATIPLLSLHSKECESIHKRNMCMPEFIAALFTIVKMWK
jgi:hypothetical protein